MKRPSLQFYPGDWASNANLARCSMAAQGAWVRILGVLHDNDAEYGVRRWPLRDLALAAAVPLRLARELADKHVLKGADEGAEPFVHVPRHAGMDGEPVVLVEPGAGPCWYSSRMVRDEWARGRRGGATRFAARGSTPPDHSPTGEPTRAVGGDLGDGASASSSASTSGKPKKQKQERTRARRAATPIPEDFGISERVAKWAQAKGFTRLPEHLEAFVGKCKAKAYAYADWDQAFMNAVREDWAKLSADARGEDAKAAAMRSLAAREGRT